MKIVRAVAAVIVKDKRFLAVKRKMTMKRDPGVWEFPGGKIEQGETIEEATRREVLEELGIICDVKERLLPFTFRSGTDEIELHYMLCALPNEAPSIQLIDHDAWAWFDTSMFHPLEWLDGDEQMLDILKAKQLL